ncbi:hypothetical protein D8674_003110 [Pyrus ussuriensis x Pyrus communis]|uniref:Uncharacterized protein n=1 Tax=Pyrus ussuriensis x Pyrus communis TaxID=2448454 RepID=A0A5N5FG60_9ROSA|nr:hypothetical protein D8674_003110 [Pyrus ussuriensis x Pyrus communis]
MSALLSWILSELITRRWSVTNAPPASSASSTLGVSAPLIEEPTPLTKAASTASQVPVSLMSSVSVQPLRARRPHQHRHKSEHSDHTSLTSRVKGASSSRLTTGDFNALKEEVPTLKGQLLMEYIFAVVKFMGTCNINLLGLCTNGCIKIWRQLHQCMRIDLIYGRFRANSLRNQTIAGPGIIVGGSGLPGKELTHQHYIRRYYFSLFLELFDISMPLMRSVVDNVSKGLSFFLKCLIGRSLGLVYTGIRQSLRWKSYTSIPFHCSLQFALFDREELVRRN